MTDRRPNVEDLLWDSLRSDLQGCSTTLEIGAMFADKLMTAPGPLRVAIEPYLPYIEQGIHRYGPEVLYIRRTAQESVGLFPENTFQATILIDFIEHLTKDDALLLIDESKRISSKVIVFTPQGYHPQTEDGTGMGAHELQTHRSTWEVKDLEELGFKTKVFKYFHLQKNRTNPNALYGVWTK